MKRLVLAAVLLVALGAPTHAQTPEAVPDFSEGLAAYENGDYATALRVFKTRAALGDFAAQYNLGVMYGLGNGVPQNHTEKANWKRKAAERGFAQAQFDLGVMYDNGEGVPQDYAEAVKWYR